MTDTDQVNRAAAGRAVMWRRWATAKRVAWWAAQADGLLHEGMTREDWASLSAGLPWASVRLCDHGDSEGVEIRYKEGRAYSAARRCGLRSGCPRCGVTIAVERRKEVEKAVSAHVKTGRGLFLATFTVRHSAPDRLKPQISVLLDALRAVQQRPEWVGMRKSLVGTHRVVEVPVGTNGWHGHVHMLGFEGDADPEWVAECAVRVAWWSGAAADSRLRSLEALAKLEEIEAIPRRTPYVERRIVSARLKLEKRRRWEARSRHYLRRAERMLSAAKATDQVAYLLSWLPEFWAEEVARLGGEHMRPSMRRGVDVRKIDETGAQYLTKISDEITDVDGKDRSVFTLLDLVDEGDAQALARWIEWSEAMHGCKASAWGGDVREVYELGEEKTDQESAQADRHGELLEIVPTAVWRAECAGDASAALARLVRWEKSLEGAMVSNVTGRRRELAVTLFGPSG